MRSPHKPLPAGMGMLCALICSFVHRSYGFELNHHRPPAEGEEDVSGAQELWNPENETARSSLEELHAERGEGSRSASEEVVSTS